MVIWGVAVPEIKGLEIVTLRDRNHVQQVDELVVLFIEQYLPLRF